MGWAFFALQAAVTFAALLWWARPARDGAMIVATGLCLAAAGYVWQGRPALRGSPAAAARAEGGRDTLFAAERGLFLERVGGDAQQLDAADAFIRNGDGGYAIGILRGAISRRPDDAVLWLGLANALTAYAEGQLTPAARFAYARAVALAPRNPAPRYFLAVARAEAGELDAAEAELAAIWRETPAAAPWRHKLFEKLAYIAAVQRRLSQTP